MANMKETNESAKNELFELFSKLRFSCSNEKPVPSLDSLGEIKRRVQITASSNGISPEELRSLHKDYLNLRNSSSSNPQR